MTNKDLLTSTSKFGYGNPLPRNPNPNEVQMFINGRPIRNFEVISSKMITIPVDVSKHDDISISYYVK